MKYKVFDNWSGKSVASGLSYLEAKKFIEQNEPPFNARAGIRYGYWPEPASSHSNGTRGDAA